ncbi:hypothetical protein V6N13_079185 [Hibiscus sabdariffa]
MSLLQSQAMEFQHMLRLLCRHGLHKCRTLWFIYWFQVYAAQVCEALLTLLVEVGQKKRHELSMKDE